MKCANEFLGEEYMTFPKWQTEMTWREGLLITHIYSWGKFQIHAHLVQVTCTDMHPYVMCKVTLAQWLTSSKVEKLHLATAAKTVCFSHAVIQRVDSVHIFFSPPLLIYMLKFAQCTETTTGWCYLEKDITTTDRYINGNKFTIIDR